MKSVQFWEQSVSYVEYNTISEKIIVKIGVEEIR